MKEDWLTQTLGELMESYCFTIDFFGGRGLPAPDPRWTMPQYCAALDMVLLEERGFDRQLLATDFASFMTRLERLSAPVGPALQTLTIRGGRDKRGMAEPVELTLKPGMVVGIVGPTGSGKSRLLADIECLAQGDTPTGRRILVNGAVPDAAQRFGLEQKLVAQLSQNMNFVVDLTVTEFIRLHAASRMIVDETAVCAAIIAQANELAGERFGADLPVTQLSGGQSRALMIADTALLSRSPLVLIDEIENAGVDRKKALALLVRAEKLVLIATHDPLLALLGDQRIILRNGGIAEVIVGDAAERSQLATLEALDRGMMRLRERIRAGERIDGATLRQCGIGN